MQMLHGTWIIFSFIHNAHQELQVIPINISVNLTSFVPILLDRI
jgi:hypothetical protein